jgi:hypothetical protein
MGQYREESEAHIGVRVAIAKHHRSSQLPHKMNPVAIPKIAFISGLLFHPSPVILDEHANLQRV